jgi:hypothetical protein
MDLGRTDNALEVMKSEMQAFKQDVTKQMGDLKAELKDAKEKIARLETDMDRMKKQYDSEEAPKWAEPLNMMCGKFGKSLEDLRKKITEIEERTPKNFDNETKEDGRKNTHAMKKNGNHDPAEKQKQDKKVSVAERIQDFERNIGKKKAKWIEEVGGENTKEVQKIANHECPGKKKDMKVSVAERNKQLERNIGKKQKNEWLEVD